MQTYKGLTSAEVSESRKKYGTNDLTPPKRESWVKLLLGKFNDPIIKLLLFATLLSLITGYFHGSMVEFRYNHSGIVGDHPFIFK